MPYLGKISEDQYNALSHAMKETFSSTKNKLISIRPTTFLDEFQHIDLAEREIKILNISIGESLEKILSYNGQLTFHGSVSDTYYYFPPEDTRKLLESIRIRTKNNDHYLTIKKKNTSKTIKEREEREIEIPDAQRYESLLLTIGLQPLYVRNKVRFSYLIPDEVGGDLTVDLDLYPGIPPMIELEGHSEEHIMTWVKKLGLENKKIVNRTARKTLEYYNNKKKK